jgi:hypothetical protein
MGLIDDIKSAAHTVAKLVDTATPDPGDWIQRSAQALGVPERYGEGLAAVFNVATGNYAGAALNAVEAFTASDDIVKATQTAKADALATPPVDPGPPPPVAAAAKPVAASPGSLAGAIALATGAAQAPATAAQPQPAAPHAQGTAAQAQPAVARPSSEATEAANAFFKLSDPAFLEKVQNHEIPPEVLGDPQQMLLLQERLHRVQELFMLLTTVMRSLHEMRMGVINNTRA